MTDYPYDSDEMPEAAGGAEPLPMQPRQRQPLAAEMQALRSREPIQQQLEQAELAAQEQDTLESSIRSTTREVDPLFAYLFLIALAIGLSTFDPMLRYVFLWSLMGAIGAMGYLLGAVPRMREAQLEDLLWGISFGVLSSLPFLVVFGDSLATISQRMFDVEGTPPRVMDTWVFMAVTFVVPMSESLFFRGAVQAVRGIFLTTLLSTLWVCILFFPHMSLGGREGIAAILVLMFSLLNFLYSYVRQRNNLTGAWLCQVVSYTLLWAVPRVLFQG